MIRIFTLAVLCAALSGCASWSPETRTEESVFQALNAADYAQTKQIVRDPDCFHEVDSARLIGAHPSERSVATLFASQAAVHFGVTGLLESSGAPPWALRLWQATTIAVEGRDVYRNWQLGIRFGMPNRAKDDQCAQHRPRTPLPPGRPE